MQGLLCVENAVDASDLEDMAKIQSRYALNFNDSIRVIHDKFWTWFSKQFVSNL